MEQYKARIAQVLEGAPSSYFLRINGSAGGPQELSSSRLALRRGMEPVLRPIPARTRTLSGASS